MVALRTWHSIFHTDFRADLRGFTVPALIIHGTVDQNAIPALTGTPTAELVPDGVYKEYQVTAVVQIPGHPGHWAFVSGLQPVACVPVVLAD